MLDKTVVWCYSIYGSNYKDYYAPLIENLKIARKIGVDVVICTTEINEARVRCFFASYLDEIQILVWKDGNLTRHPKILRFLASEVIEADFYFYKDSDSIVTDKELRVMSDWMLDPRGSWMLIRDHPLHVAPILAGMCGCTDEAACVLARQARMAFDTIRPRFTNTYSYDQDWLMSDIYPFIRLHAQVYSSYLAYTGERVTEIEREEDEKHCIGAQIGTNNLKKGGTWLSALYGDETLIAPFFLCRKIYYGRVRPTILFAFFHKIFRRIFFQHGS